ncbi:insulinase family protein [Candidatus Parcubacteria bacterium]|nr:insulinase family protein [Candidatus Parcubacteria bacterium]
MKYYKDVLDNGLRVITVPMKDSQSAIAMVAVEAGSHYEDKKINGLSHFLEHMCFKGTENRTGEQINYELDSLGAESNAFTSDEFTGYYAKAHSKKVGKILDVVSDMYLNPLFPEKDIETERGVIIEEINMYEDLPMRNVEVLMEELLYGDQPAGRPILGPKENIKKFTRDDFVNYYETHYIPQKTVVVVAGNIDKKDILKQVKEKFGKAKTAKVVKKQKIKISQKTPAIKIKNKKLDQTHLRIGFHSFKLGDKRNIPLAVAKTILGGGMSSRLFRKMREELGMCYYTRAMLSTSTDAGNFVVAAGVGNSRAEEAVSVIIDEFKKLRDDEIDEKELKKAKEFIMGNMATSHETSESWADYFGFQELLHQEIKTLKQIEKEIRAVTVKDIKRVLKQVIKKDKLNLAMIGPHKDSRKFEKHLKV